MAAKKEHVDVVLPTSGDGVEYEVIKRRVGNIRNLFSAVICRGLLRFSPKFTNTSSAIS